MSHEQHLIRLYGIVERVTFHNIENGWSVLKVSPFNEPNKLVTVLIHQAKVFAGSSMEFWGVWNHHPKHGEQFKSEKVIEKKPASSAALEKYLGSGLIKGVGPMTAGKIVKFFREQTLEIFEERIDDLLKVPGIAEKKLVDIKHSWNEHKSIRDVMLFLQEYGISSLYAVKIYKEYGNNAIQIVSLNPYRLAKDIYGIGFFSADKIALNMGFERDGAPRTEAGIKHVLASSREEGHCFLTESQIITNTLALLGAIEEEKVRLCILSLIQKNEIKMRLLQSAKLEFNKAYYSNSLYFDELYVAKRVKQWTSQLINIDLSRVKKWVESYCERHQIKLSEEQTQSIIEISGSSFSILTGGPGCGKTTTTKVLVKLLVAMNKKVILAAPTGRAAQRMKEVIGLEAKTIHRLLEWAPEKNGFKKSEEDPLKIDFLLVDECSMLDINLAASLLKALPQSSQILFIGDPDQLSSVGAGNVLQDLILAHNVPSFKLTKIFRQAEESLIIRYAHQINRGEIPKIASPFYDPKLLKDKAGCLFVDAEEATLDQIRFLQKAKCAIERTLLSGDEQLIQTGEKITGIMKRQNEELKVESFLVQEFNDKDEIRLPAFVIPEKFKHVNLENIQKATGDIEKLQSILKSIHPWSALHYGMTSLDVIIRMYIKTIPEYFGNSTEIQVLTPQTRGSLGTHNLNTRLQSATNPERNGVKQIKIGDRIYREGDRVIQTKNNYDLEVYNGDIGRIKNIDLENYKCHIQFNKQNPIIYEKEDLTEITLAYAITIHKSQGSEFDAIIIPISTQHYNMLFRNLIYTGLTRAKKLCIFVGSRKALALAVKQIDNRMRQTALTILIEE